jgi:hypothetical protein
MDAPDRAFEHPPADPHPILASDAEREQTIGRLREAVGEGRLTLEELSEPSPGGPRLLRGE